MTADPSVLGEIASKGGPLALVALVALALKYAVEGVVAWRTNRRADESTTVVDAAAANVTLVDLLGLERKDNERLQVDNDKLRRENDTLRKELLDQRRSYEAEVNDLRSKIQDVTIQLEGLQARIRAGLPNQ